MTFLSCVSSPETFCCSLTCHGSLLVRSAKMLNKYEHVCMCEEMCVVCVTGVALLKGHLGQTCMLGHVDTCKYLLLVLVVCFGGLLWCQP